MTFLKNDTAGKFGDLDVFCSNLSLGNLLVVFNCCVF